MAPEKNSLAST